MSDLVKILTQMNTNPKGVRYAIQKLKVKNDI